MRFLLNLVLLSALQVGYSCSVPNYELQILPDEFLDCQSLALNDRGQIVGLAPKPNGNTAIVFYEMKDEKSQLELFEIGLRLASTQICINNLGQVLLPKGIWSKAQGLIPIPSIPIPSPNTCPIKINACGTTLYQLPNGEQLLFSSGQETPLGVNSNFAKYFEESGNLTKAVFESDQCRDLRNLGYRLKRIYVNDVNRFGHLVGVVELQRTSRLDNRVLSLGKFFVWDGELHVSPGNGNGLIRINDRGQIFVQKNYQGQIFIGYNLNQLTQMHLDIEPGTIQSVKVCAINNRDQILAKVNFSGRDCVVLLSPVQEDFCQETVQDCKIPALEDYCTKEKLPLNTQTRNSALLLDVMVKYSNNSDGIPALLYAAKKGDQRAVKLLLAHGADIHTKDAFGASILKYALLSKDKDLVKFVLDEGVDVNAKKWESSNDYDALNVFYADDPELFDLLIERGFNFKSESIEQYHPFKGEESLIHFCVNRNSSKLLRHLIQNGYSVNSDGIWQSLYARSTVKSMEQRLDNFNYLLKIGILNPHTQSSCAIYALFQLPASFLQSCIDRKFNFKGIKDQYGWTLLRTLAQCGGMECLEKIQLLLKNGAQVNEKDSTYGRTPLMHAVQQGKEDVVRLLLENGADPNLKDNGGYSLFNLNGSNEMRKLLRDFGSKE